VAIDIVIVDDHAVVREGLRAYLGRHDDLHVVGETDDEAAAVQLVETLAPDVVLMDLRLRGGSGVDAVRRLRRRGARCRVVAYTSYSDEQHVRTAMDAGVEGYVLKDADVAEVVTAVRSVHAGRPYVSREAATRLQEHVHGSDLTARERDILTLLAEGHPNKIIARRLGIAEETVKAHMKSIFGKLGAANRTEAVSQALARGYIHA
jgi:DNA-binding NarL/FixJ family response regulator